MNGAIQNSPRAVVRKVNPYRMSIPTISDFEFMRPLAKGGYSRVYLARKRRTGDIYAVKVLRKSFLKEKNAVFNILAEKKIMEIASSPFVVPMYYSFHTKNHLFLVMEYMPGGDCYSLLKIRDRFDERMARVYIAEVLLALEYLHGRGIVHRDVKPDNMLISAEGHIRLTDFGLSKMGLTRNLNRSSSNNALDDAKNPSGNTNAANNSNNNSNSNHNQLASNPSSLSTTYINMNSHSPLSSHSHTPQKQRSMSEGEDLNSSNEDSLLRTNSSGGGGSGNSNNNNGGGNASSHSRLLPPPPNYIAPSSASQSPVMSSPIGSSDSLTSSMEDLVSSSSSSSLTSSLTSSASLISELTSSASSASATSSALSRTSSNPLELSTPAKRATPTKNPISTPNTPDLLTSSAPSADSSSNLDSPNSQPASQQNSGVKGTPDYLSPEVILGIGHGKAVDWWALGCVLYEFLVGVPPFFGETIEEIFQNILSRRIIWPDNPKMMSSNARDLIDQLLNQDVTKRLGANGAAEIKAHPFFSSINWEEVLVLKQKAVFTPKLASESDTKYFNMRFEEDYPGVSSSAAAFAGGVFQDDDDHYPNGYNPVLTSPTATATPTITAANTVASPHNAIKSPISQLASFSASARTDSVEELILENSPQGRNHKPHSPSASPSKKKNSATANKTSDTAPGGSNCNTKNSNNNNNNGKEDGDIDPNDDDLRKSIELSTTSSPKSNKKRTVSPSKPISTLPLSKSTNGAPTVSSPTSSPSSSKKKNSANGQSNATNSNNALGATELFSKSWEDLSELELYMQRARSPGVVDDAFYGFDSVVTRNLQARNASLLNNNKVAKKSKSANASNAASPTTPTNNSSNNNNNSPSSTNNSSGSSGLPGTSLSFGSVPSSPALTPNNSNNNNTSANSPPRDLRKSNTKKKSSS